MNALCKETLQSLEELGSVMGPSFFAQLLKMFQHTAVEHLAVLRSAIAGGEAARLGREAHRFKGASLAVGADGMAEICSQLENLGTAKNLGGAPAALACLEREFERVKSEIEQQLLIP